MGVSVRNVPGPSGRDPLAGQRAGDRERREQRHEPAEQHREAAQEVGERDPEGAGVAGRVRLDEARVAGEGGAVVVGLGGVGVERLGEALRPGVEDRRRARTWWRSRAPWRSAPRAARTGSRSSTSFTSRASIFLPRYSGVRPTIRPAMKTASSDEQQHRVEAGPDAAEDHLPGRHVEHRHEAADAGQRVERRVDRAVRRVRRDGRPEGGVGDPEALLLALEVAAGSPATPAAMLGPAPACRSARRGRPPPTADDEHREHRARRAPSPGGGCRACARTIESAPPGSTGSTASRRSSRARWGSRTASALLTLKKPPPLVPSSLMISCEATGPSASVWSPPASVANES